jgi:ubiquinone/menaquinone biosynthesis C-methylase UbiE
MRWYEEYKEIYLSELKAVQSLELRNCVDVGSGPGPFHEALKGYIISLDLSLVSLYFTEGDRIQADALYLPFRNGGVPCVFSSVTLCFLEDVEAFMREVARVAKNEVALCVIVSDSPWGKHYMELGKRGHPYYSRARFLSREGFVSLFSKYFDLQRLVSVLTRGPGEEESVEEPSGGDGSYICALGLSRNRV